MDSFVLHHHTGPSLTLLPGKLHPATKERQIWAFCVEQLAHSQKLQ